MGALQADTAVTLEGERLVARLSRDWEIWGPNGGYLSAIALRAAGAVAPPDHRPATLTVQYVGVADFSDVDCQVTPVKQGRSAWLLNVALVQNGRTFLQAQVWTTNKTEGPLTGDAAMPDIPPPSQLKTFGEHMAAHYGDKAPPTHTFWRNIESKPLAWKPFDAPREARPATLTQWYSFPGFDAAGDPFADFAQACVLIDTLIWPTHHSARAEPPDYIAPSLDLTIWFHQAPAGAEWLLLDTAADIAGGGLIHGRSRLWTEDGRPVATGGSHLLHTPRRAG